jgi:DNA-binding transcriptional LysR family regulator
MDAAMAAMARVRTGEVGRLVLGITTGVDPNLVASLLAAAGEDVEVEPRQVTSAEALLGLGRSELDAALIHAVPDDKTVAHVVVARDELGVALPSGHRLARRKAVPPAALSGEPLAWLRRRWEPTLYDDVLARLSAVGFEPGPPRETPNVETSLSLVAAGLAISFKFASEVTRRRYVGVVWRPFADVDVPVPTTLIWRRGDRSPVVAAVVSAARQLADAR